MSTIKCPNCGNTLPEDSAFCNKCGSRIESEGRSYRRDYEDWSDDDRDLRRVQFTKGSDTSWELGTTISERSKDSTMVERSPIRRTVPHCP